MLEVQSGAGPEPGRKSKKYVGTYAEVCLPQAMQFLDDVFADIDADDEICFFTDDGLGAHFPKGSPEILPFLDSQYGRDVRLSLVTLRGRVFGFFANFDELPGGHDGLWPSASMHKSEYSDPCVWLFDAPVDLSGMKLAGSRGSSISKLPWSSPGPSSTVISGSAPTNSRS